MKSQAEKNWEGGRMVFTIAETCKILGVSRNTLANMIALGQFKAIKASERRWLVPRWSLEQFLGKPGA